MAANDGRDIDSKLLQKLQQIHGTNPDGTPLSKEKGADDSSERRKEIEEGMKNRWIAEVTQPWSGRRKLPGGGGSCF